MRYLLGIWTLIGLSGATVFAQDIVGDRFYITLFGGHANILRPRTGHTWATLTRISTTPTGEKTAETHTISWMPATLEIRPFAPRAEKGVNLTHEQSMEFMGSGRLPWVKVFGPYEIDRSRYEQGLAQKALLESGAIKYHGLGLFGRRSDVMHCIDAVTRTDPKWEDKASPSVANGVLGTGQAAIAMKQSGFANTRPSHRDLLPLIMPPNSLRLRNR